MWNTDTITRLSIFLISVSKPELYIWHRNNKNSTPIRLFPSRKCFIQSFTHCQSFGHSDTHIHYLLQWNTMIFFQNQCFPDWFSILSACATLFCLTILLDVWHTVILLLYKWLCVHQCSSLFMICYVQNLPVQCY